MAYLDEYGLPQPDGFAYDQLGVIVALAQASWSAEQIKVCGDDRTTSIGHDQARHILLAAEHVRALARPAMPPKPTPKMYDALTGESVSSALAEAGLLRAMVASLKFQIRNR